MFPIHNIMRQVRKTVFDPLATSKARVREILQELPVGSAHPWSPERILLCRTDDGIKEIDISLYSDESFVDPVDFSEMGETLLRRMAGFQPHLGVFDDFRILQVPSSTFKVPIKPDQITILAVSQTKPSYFDLCLADASCNTSFWAEKCTFSGITHSGDIRNGDDILQHIKIDADTSIEEEICVFISAFNYTLIRKFLGTHPALLVADHVEKILYIIPVPLDAATIGDASICCPLVIKCDGESLVCSILPVAATDRGKECFSAVLKSDCFPEAIQRADLNIPSAFVGTKKAPNQNPGEEINSSSPKVVSKTMSDSAVFTTDPTTLPSFLNLESTQIIHFKTGIHFTTPGEQFARSDQSSAFVLPCIFGSRLEGPLLLATGNPPSNVPFVDEVLIVEYYKRLNSAVVVVNDRMADTSRSVAGAYRINALFIVQLNLQNEPRSTEELLLILNSANINAVTALAGLQSLVVVQIFQKYYFYRGLANSQHINTARTHFGTEVTSILESVSMDSILDPRVPRVISLENPKSILLLKSGQWVQPQHLERLFDGLTARPIHSLEEDILSAIPQLEVILNEKDLRDLCRSLVAVLTTAIGDVVALLRNAYTKFLTEEYKIESPESAKKKAVMLGKLTRATREMHITLEPVISVLANTMSSQKTSKRTHDLKRLFRQCQIQRNVEATKAMTFETLSDYFERYAEDMGVMLLNISTDSYSRLLGDVKETVINASLCCELDSRVLYLQGFDAGIIIEQSQGHHNGPLQSQLGPTHPILALPYLSQDLGSGSMLAWVCWDEFVDLKNPFTVRWHEKCNEEHIAAFRIIMRSTLSQSVASREHHLKPDSLETGNLMCALLMAAMTKLAARRTTKPVVSAEADDTVTKLMRGLFGNLLTTAASGLRPLSMIWQLFVPDPQYHLPRTKIEWVWYENVIDLYTYTAWPLEQFHRHLEKLLDEALMNFLSRNEDLARFKLTKRDDLAMGCKLRNVQLKHYRTIITVLERILTGMNIDIAAAADRLLKHVPHEPAPYSQGYIWMIEYLHHLARGGQRRYSDDLAAARLYNSHSACYSELKRQVVEACKSNEWAKMKNFCQEMMDMHAKIAAIWQVKPESMEFQNMILYRKLLNADFGESFDPIARGANLRLSIQVRGDAEIHRVPWQVGDKHLYNHSLEPLDDTFIQHILTGSGPQSSSGIVKTVPERGMTTMVRTRIKDEFAQFASLMNPSFIATMQSDLSADDVCRIIDVPTTTMRVFIKALNPEFRWDNLGESFQKTIMGILKSRSSGIAYHPTRELLNLESAEQSLQSGD